MGKSSLLLVTLIVFSATRVCAGDSLSDAQIKSAVDALGETIRAL